MTHRRAAGSSAPHAAGAEAGRRIGVGLMYGLWRPRVLGARNVPPGGPVVLAGNHSNALDGPLLVGTTPRPVHFLVKQEVFASPLGPFLRAIGQLPVDRDGPDRSAVTAALDVLRGGGVLGIFPEGTRGGGEFAEVRSGLAYFALRGGAPVVPVACFGTAERGRVVRGLPPLRGRVDIVYGKPFTLGDGSRRVGRRALAEASAEARERLAAHLADARRITGRGRPWQAGPQARHDPDEGL